MNRHCIFNRIDAALEKVRARQMEVRAIYLDPEDDAAFIETNTKYWRKALDSRATFYATDYAGHHLRQGTRSQIFSTDGVAVAIPKKLSARVAA